MRTLQSKVPCTPLRRDGDYFTLHVGADADEDGHTIMDKLGCDWMQGE